MSAAMTNPARRPMRFISNEAGSVHTIVARNCNAIGKVARALVVASAKPTSGVTAIKSELQVIMTAWQVASITTFFLFLSTPQRQCLLMPNLDARSGQPGRRWNGSNARCEETSRSRRYGWWSNPPRSSPASS